MYWPLRQVAMPVPKKNHAERNCSIKYEDKAQFLPKMLDSPWEREPT